ncbi:MAG: YbfB/YjiJ family MFS transporter [Pseudomonadota bacterium]
MIQPNRISVLFSGICALILSMGIARYSFTPMIPAMQDQVGVTESLAGWMAGWNYIGYLTGLFIVWLISDLRAKDFFYRYGLLVTVIATAFMAAHDNRMVWYMSRFFCGVSSATGFILGTGLILNWLHHNGYKSELGLHFSGVGLGIVASAIIVDLTDLDAYFALNWRLQWVALAGVGALLTVPAMFLLPRPGEREIEMARESDVMETTRLPSARYLLLLQAAYFCAGFSNTVNVTFTSLITELQPLEGWGSRMWLAVGLAATPAPFIWDRISKRLGSLDALRIAFVMNVLGNLCLAFTVSLTTTVFAAVLFGFTFMGIVSQTLSLVGRRYGPRATQIMAQLTLGYCVAQILSPIISGIVAEMTGSFQPSLYVITGFMILGLICLLLMRYEFSPTKLSPA